MQTPAFDRPALQALLELALARVLLDRGVISRAQFALLALEEPGHGG